MKNKFLNKFVVLTLCVTIVTSIFVISSSALSYEKPSSLNNPVSSFLLPDVYVTFNTPDGSFDAPLSSYFARGTHLVSSLLTSYDVYDNVNYIVNNNIRTLNVYNTGFANIGTFDITSNVYGYQLPTDFFRFSSLNLRNYWCNNIASGTDQNSFIFYFTERPFVEDSDGNISAAENLSLLFKASGVMKDGSKFSFETFYDTPIEAVEWGLDANIVYRTKVNLFPRLTNFDWYNVLYINDLSISYLYNTDSNLVPFMDNRNENYPVSYSFNYEFRLQKPSQFSNVSYDTLYNSIYNEGVDSVASGDVNWYDSIISAVTSFVNWEFIPGLSFGIVLSVFAGGFLLIIFLRKLAGG